MSARIIPFLAARIYRHPDLIDALDRLALCDDYEASENPIERITAEHLRPYWEGELARLGGVSPSMLRKDGEAEA